MLFGFILVIRLLCILFPSDVNIIIIIKLYYRLAVIHMRRQYESCPNYKYYKHSLCKYCHRNVT